MSGLVYISPVADSIPFDNSTNGFTSTNLQDAVLEAKVTAVSPDNFSYKNIVAAKTVIIPADQEMIVKQKITVRGQLVIRGELVVI